jgi:hypothetical protein
MSAENTQRQAMITAGQYAVDDSVGGWAVHKGRFYRKLMNSRVGVANARREPGLDQVEAT